LNLIYEVPTLDLNDGQFQWKNNKAAIQEQGQEMAEAIRAGAQQNVGTAKPPEADTAMQKCFQWLAKKFDSVNGGFGSAPKFPKAGWPFDYLFGSSSASHLFVQSTWTSCSISTRSTNPRRRPTKRWKCFD
jgi:hypothetical protein